MIFDVWPCTCRYKVKLAVKIRVFDLAVIMVLLMWLL
jgi:hypothetical protein